MGKAWSTMGLLTAALSMSLASSALADVPVSLGSLGAVDRAGLTQDARKNPTGASFGAPVSDDRRLFTLRWRLPWLAVGGAAGPSPFSTGFVSTGYRVGGLSLAAEPMDNLSAFIPQGQIGEANKLGRLQFGALSYTMGHGTAVDRFTNSPDGLARRFGLLAEINLAGLAGQVAVADALDAASFVSVRVAGRPIMWFLAPDATFQPNEFDVDPRTEVFGIWQVGLATAADFTAPGSLGQGSAVVASFENEAAVLDNQFLKLIAYADLNGLWTRDGDDAVSGVGVHPGARFMWDMVAFRVDVDAEANIGGDGYSPRYFDRLYFLERTSTIGALKPKLLLERPASWGYRARADVSLLRSITLFGEVRDQQAFEPTFTGSNMTATVGATAWVLMAGGAVTATQTGLGDNGFFGPGFVVTAEGRVGLVLNVVHVVGRAWQAHLAAGDDPGEYVVERGMSAGLEVNFDLL